ncbi:MAG: hypothetical protein Q8M08_03225 [Bacteroidales bacterium]|nr:hypothetical protein [Bacteroidales bacterium]
MAADQKIKPETSKKDRWEKADIILRPVGALITALTIAFVSYAASNYLSKNQEKEAKTKLYTELMTKREDSESALRKDMFNSIMNNILNDKAKVSLDEKILQLELLTYNFHESLNLMPLFEYLNRSINDEIRDLVLRKAYKRRLIKMSRAIIAKQLSSLETVSKPVTFYYEDTLFNYKNGPRYKNDSTYRLIIDELHEQNSTALNGSLQFCTYVDSVFNGKEYDSLQRVIRIKILDYDTVDASVKIRLTIQSIYLGKQTTFELPRQTEFMVSYFEFPMIDNTRLTNDMRLAVVLNGIVSDKYPNATGQPVGNRIRIELKVIYFPGSRSSLKEKPYFDDIVSKLLLNN